MTHDAHQVVVPESELLEQTLQGDREAFGALVGRYQSLVCSLAYSIVGDVPRSEDIAQEAFVTAWKKLATLDDRAKFKAWLCGISRNVALGSLRRQTRTVSSEGLAEPQSLEPSPLDAAIAREEAALVWEVLQELPENYREPLVLFYREEQSVARVAEALDLSEDAARQRLSRGREMLRMQVAATVERALARSRPGPIFTAAVLGMLPAFAAGSAVAATVGAAGKVSIPIAKVGISASFLAPLMGTLGGLAGAGIGAWATHQTARFQRQRDLIRRSTLVFLVCFAVFMLPYLAIEAGLWKPAQGNLRAYVAFQILWIFSWFAILFLLSWRLGKQARRIAAEEIAAGTPQLPHTSFARRLAKVQGRQWRSRWSFCGLPLVDIRFANPYPADSEFERSGSYRGLGWARGWIALGDKAQGVLFAAGNIAIGGLAVGGVSCGLLSLGGLACGLFPIGGFAVGVFPFAGFAAGWRAVGGLACGWWAVGGAAIAWQAANGGKGGLAWAHDYAVGQHAFATHANDEAAKAFLRDHAFFDSIERMLATMAPFFNGPWFVMGVVAFTVLLPLSLWLVGYRRRRPT
jgi:RNA polymerase sigma factor (sigma-70 family)